MEHALFFMIFACAIGFLMTWGVGANDLANVMSTTLGSKAVTVRQAMLIAIIFEFAGAVLGSGEVSNTIQTGIINMGVFSHTPEILVFGMLSVLLAGTTWITIASYLGLPVSITNAIVGGLVGFGAVILGIHAIHWQQVTWIALSWITSPILAGIAAFLLFRSIQRLILGSITPFANAQRYLPIYFFLVGIILAFMIVIKGMRHFHIQVDHGDTWLIVLSTSLVVTVVGFWFIKRIEPSRYYDPRDRFAPVEKLFSILMAFTACAMVFAHGSNDVAIAVGPMAAVISLAHDGQYLSAEKLLPTWLVFLGCLGVVTGLFMYGRKVIETVGSGITTLTPSRAFSATLAAASTVIGSTSIGIPVSATQTLVGAVLGVGLARGIGALNLSVIRNILLSWLITIPAASLLAILYFYLLRIII